MKVIIEIEIEFKYPEGWIAEDENGFIYEFESKPSPKVTHWSEDKEVFTCIDIRSIDGFFKTKGISWKDSLMTVSEFKEKYGVL